MAALAAEAADDRPRAAMIAAPRLPTVEQEGGLEPLLVADHLAHGRALDTGIGEVGEHRRRVVAEDDDVLDVGDTHPGLLRQLGPCAVLVEARHGREPLGPEALGLGRRDHDVGVAGVADDDDARLRGGDLVDGRALLDEDLAVVLQQVGALHAGPTGLAAHQDRPVDVGEGLPRVPREHQAAQQREGAVVELHGDALQRLLNLVDRDLQQLEDDRLVLAERLAGGDARKDRVADLARGARDGDAQRGLLGAHAVTDSFSTSASATPEVPTAVGSSRSSFMS